MRALIIGLAILAAACSVETGKGGRSAGGGYTVEIRANGNDQVYVVTGPDGRSTAARAHEGTSAMLNADELHQTLASMPAPSTGRYDEHNVSIRAPGFSLEASGDEHIDSDSTTTADDQKPVSSDEHERGHVTMNIGGFGLNVNADDRGPGEDDDVAQVRLTGLSARDARRFIVEADELSPDVQSQMLSALGLSQNTQD